MRSWKSQDTWQSNKAESNWVAAYILRHRHIHLRVKEPQPVKSRSSICETRIGPACWHWEAPLSVTGLSVFDVAAIVLFFQTTFCHYLQFMCVSSQRVCHIKCLTSPIVPECRWLIKPSHSESAKTPTHLPSVTQCCVPQTLHTNILCIHLLKYNHVDVYNLWTTLFFKWNVPLCSLESGKCVDFNVKCYIYSFFQNLSKN